MSLKAVNALLDSSSGFGLVSNTSGFFMSANTLKALLGLLDVSTAGRLDSNMSGVLISAKALKPSALLALLMLMTWAKY